jgi:hypothetical protein
VAEEAGETSVVIDGSIFTLSTPTALRSRPSQYGCCALAKDSSADRLEVAQRFTSVLLTQPQQAQA